MVVFKILRLFQLDIRNLYKTAWEIEQKNINSIIN